MRILKFLRSRVNVWYNDPKPNVKEKPMFQIAPDGESVKSKHNRAVSMFKSRIEGDGELREFSHIESCYHECMNVRQHLLDTLDSMYWRD